MPEPVSQQTAPQSAPAADSNSAKRPTLTQVLPSERLSLEKQIATLRAFGAAFASNGGRPVTNEAAASIIGISGTTAVVTNPFFTTLGLLTRQKDSEGFIPSQELLSYVSQFEWGPEQAKEKLRPVFERMWFATALLPRLKFRAYDIKEAMAVLAEACNASKDQEPRLERLIEYMAFFGLIAREGSLVKPSTFLPAPPVEAAPANTPPAPTPIETPDSEAGGTLLKSVLPLEANSQRRFVVWAPPTITKKELERVKKWLEVQIIVSDEGSA